MNTTIKIGVLLVTLLFCFLLNINVGSVSIPSYDTFKILTTGYSDNASWAYIILDYRLPKAITAILVGSGLGISGLLMQTLFKNPLAGPFVLGISSGASLGVALIIMGATLFGGLTSGFILNKWSLVVASSVGSFLVLLAIISAASKVRNIMSILIIGLMFGSLASALVSVLSYFSSAEELQQYVFWGMGSLGNLSWGEVGVFFSIYSLGLVLSVLCIKPLNSLLLGENYARSMGVNTKNTRLFILLATSLLAGSATAFAGPIAFIGLAVPHLVRLVFNTSNHQLLVPLVIVFGAILMLICDSIAQVPGSSVTLPINAITSLFGAPIVIWLLVKKRKLVL